MTDKRECGPTSLGAPKDFGRLRVCCLLMLRYIAQGSAYPEQRPREELSLFTPGSFKLEYCPFCGAYKPLTEEVVQ